MTLINAHQEESAHGVDGLRMGRTVIIEERVEGDLGRLFAAQAVQIGLLVGQVCSTYIRVLHICSIMVALVQ